MVGVVLFMVIYLVILYVGEVEGLFCVVVGVLGVWMVFLIVVIILFVVVVFSLFVWKLVDDVGEGFYGGY